MVVIEAPVLVPGQLDDLLADLRRQLPRRTAAAIAMDYSAHALLSDPGLEPKALALGDPKHHGCLCHRQLPAKYALDDCYSLLFSHRQGYGLHTLT